jgi:hypothetical protein
MRTVLLPLFLIAVACAEDCKDCAADKACLTHEAADDIAVKDAQAKLKTKDMIGKREAIHGLAAAQEKHMNCLSRKISMELLKGLADADVDVKLLAAEKLAAIGIPDLAAQGMARECAAYKKQISPQRPKKPAEAAKWDVNLKLLERMYESLGQVKSPAAAKVFEEDVKDSNPWIGRAAANATAPFKGQKGIVNALFEAMKKWLGPSTQVDRPEGSVEAFFAMSKGLAGVVENPPKDLDGKTQPQSMAIWDVWWKANGGKYQ